MNRLSLLMLILLVSFSTSATLYKVVKPDGTVVYTDKPQPGAVKVNLNNVNTATMPSMAKPKPKAEVKRRVKPPVDYQLTLLEPADQQTIRDNSGSFRVRAKLSPQGAGQYQVLINEQVVDTQAIPTFMLKGINRGEHKIQVRYIGKSGKVLATSPIHTLYLHRASLLAP